MAAIKKHLSVIYKIEFKGEARIAYELSAIRRMYRENQYAHLLQIRVKSAIDKKELMDILTQLPVRAKANCLVNLVMANRSNKKVIIVETSYLKKVDMLSETAFS